jgi:hypothetical protein
MRKIHVLLFAMLLAILGFGVPLIFSNGNPMIELFFLLALLVGIVSFFLKEPGEGR